MIRREHKTVTVTAPPTRAERDLMAEYEELAALPERSEAQVARMTELGAGLMAEQLLFTVDTLNTLQWSRYRANERAMFDWIEQETGLPYSKLSDHPRLEELLGVGLRWARVAAAVGSVQQRTVPRMFDMPGEVAWNPVDYEGFDDIPTMMETVPAALADVLDALAIELNNALFGRQADDEGAKKNGGISVDWSDRSSGKSLRLN